MHISSICWSQTGSSIAVGYGSNTHLDWCKHTGLICFWNIGLRGLDPKKPNAMLETNAFLYNLELCYINGFQSLNERCRYCRNVQWRAFDLQYTGANYIGHFWQFKSCASGFRDASHLDWLKLGILILILIASCGNDGKILVWNFADMKTPKRW